MLYTQNINDTDGLPPRLLTAKEVATHLNVSRSFAYTLIQTGQIPAVRLGRSVRVRPQDLEAYIASNTSIGIRGF